MSARIILFFNIFVISMAVIACYRSRSNRGYHYYDPMREPINYAADVTRGGARGGTRRKPIQSHPIKPPARRGTQREYEERQIKMEVEFKEKIESSGRYEGNGGSPDLSGSGTASSKFGTGVSSPAKYGSGKSDSGVRPGFGSGSGSVDSQSGTGYGGYGPKLGSGSGYGGYGPGPADGTGGFGRDAGPSGSGFGSGESGSDPGPGTASGSDGSGSGSGSSANGLIPGSVGSGSVSGSGSASGGYGPGSGGSGPRPGSGGPASGSVSGGSSSGSGNRPDIGKPSAPSGSSGSGGEEEESALEAMGKSALEGLTRFGKGSSGNDVDLTPDLEDESYKKYSKKYGKPKSPKAKNFRHSDTPERRYNGRRQFDDDNNGYGSDQFERDYSESGSPGDRRPQSNQDFEDEGNQRFTKQRTANYPQRSGSFRGGRPNRRNAPIYQQRVPDYDYNYVSDY